MSVPSPCFKCCGVTLEDECEACHRKMDEIRDWGRTSDNRKHEILERIERTWGDKDRDARKRILDYVEKHPGVDRVYLLDHGVTDVASYQIVYLIYHGFLIAKYEPMQRLYPVGREHTHLVDDS